MTGEKRFLRSIKLRNFLSYGNEGCEVELNSLNVLIGPNASGKSNLIEAIGVLKAAPTDLSQPFKGGGGGVGEWIWKNPATNDCAEIEVVIYHPTGTQPLRYRLKIGVDASTNLTIVDEAVENERAMPGEDDTYFYYRYQNGRPVVNIRSVQEEKPDSGFVRRSLQREDLEPGQSVLSQKRDTDIYPELTYLGKNFARFTLYREWNVGRSSLPRLSQKTDLSSSFLLEDASNLALVLNNLEYRGLELRLKEDLKKFYPNAEAIKTHVFGGNVELLIQERDGDTKLIPASRLSDGTLRYLCLLAILRHPDPPPLICIEEPELGLHPDILPQIGELLMDASQRTQLIVTTHSDALVSALSQSPECVLVCERLSGVSSIHRLDREQLVDWLQEYKLGEIWRMGQIGGNP